MHTFKIFVLIIVLGFYFNKAFYNMNLYINYIYIYIIIYEIKYKTNVVTQSFMPEFTDNLRTTKVLYIYIYIYLTTV
jgi:hypothetical protein